MRAKLRYQKKFGNCYKIEIVLKSHTFLIEILNGVKMFPDDN